MASGNTGGVKQNFTNLFDERTGGPTFAERYTKVATDKASLGQGTYGTVYRYVRKGTDSSFVAVKAIKRQKVGDADKFRTELDTMSKMDHPNVVHLYEVFEDAQAFKLIMELCTGGELFDAIIENESFTEVQAQHLVRQMVSSVFYCHENQIVHRDLKPENFLLASKETNPMLYEIKLIDFGLAKSFEEGQLHRTKAGTPYYVAPQVLEGKYTEKCDVWSLGVITYIMLCGYPPFYGDTDGEILKKVRKGAYQFDPAEWGGVSAEAKFAISKMLTKDEKARPSAKEVLAIDWVAGKKPTGGGDVNLNSKVVNNMRDFVGATQFKKAVLITMANQLCNADTDLEIKKLAEVFRQYDDDGNGTLTYDELKQALGATNMSDDLLAGLDYDGSQKIEYSEFLAAAVDASKLFNENKRLHACFTTFDTNNDGVLSREEVREVIKSFHQNGYEDGSYTDADLDEEVKKIFEDVDADNNGCIDEQEFQAYFQEVQKNSPKKS